MREPTALSSRLARWLREDWDSTGPDMTPWDALDEANREQYHAGADRALDATRVAAELRDAEIEVNLALGERDEARAEVQRLRARVHEAVDECQRRYGPVESQLAKLRKLMHEAGRRHNEEMVRLGRQPGTYISGYGQATAASIIGERDEALATLRQVERDRDTLHASHEAALAERDQAYARGVEAGRRAAAHAIEQRIAETPSNNLEQARLRRHLVIAARLAEIPISPQRAAELIADACERGAVVVVHTSAPEDDRSGGSA